MLLQRRAVGLVLLLLAVPDVARTASALELRGRAGRSDRRTSPRSASTSEQAHHENPEEDHVVARPGLDVGEPDEKYQGKRWNLESSEGGSQKGDRWRKKKGGGAVAWFGALSFVGLIGSLPIILAWSYKYVTRTQILESFLLYVWLLGGLYLFTEVLIFQSPHFERPRTLSVEEATYLFAQILTTVGYGDITPARPRGQLFVGIFVLLSVLLIANMITELLEFFQSIIERKLKLDEDPAKTDHTTEEQKLKAAFEPVIYTALVFMCFVSVGTGFFVLYPGEGKTTAQGVYMSMITLSTVGFGAFTPVTHAGMVFGAFWMVFGCASLVAVITCRGAFSLALKRYEIKMLERQYHSEDNLPSETRLAEVRQQQKELRKALRK